jgi:hypothetical protein
MLKKRQALSIKMVGIYAKLTCTKAGGDPLDTPIYG